MEFPDTHGRVYSESSAFDYASVTFKESDGYVTVLTGRGTRCECFCRDVPRKGQRLKDLEHFLAVMRARYPSLQVRSEDEEALRTMKEMVQRQKDDVFSLGIKFSIKHYLFALLVRHNEWILNHLVRNDFVIELDNRVIKTSPVMRVTLEILLQDQLHFSIVSWSVDVMMTTNNHDFKQLGFSV